jgi:glycosyltransferase involved in cell wall biosynthesis
LDKNAVVANSKLSERLVGKSDIETSITLNANPMKHPRRIFIDASYTLFSGKSSGIERVVRNIVRESSLFESGMRPQVVFSHRGEFYPVNERQMCALGKPARMQAALLSQLPKMYRQAATILCDYLPSRTLRRWLLPEVGHLGLFKLPHTIYEEYMRARVISASNAIVPDSGDLFLLPDAYWTKRNVWAAVDNARSRGAMVATLLYDLIPLTHPEFVGMRRRDSFLQYIKNVSSKSDLIVAISDTVRDQVSQMLPEICGNAKRCADIRYFELGAELADLKGHVRDKVATLFSPKGKPTPYLMVATFDPRKNHRFLIQAFDMLWEQNPDIQLCLAGRVGWMCEDILMQLERHPKRDNALHVFHDLSDVELQHCYSSARGVIFPSIVEGFGLPIVESLWHGQKTFASDTPIHREVGRGDCCYFDLADPNSLVSSIQDWERQLAQGRPHLPIRQPIQWSESNQQLFCHCLDAFRTRQSTVLRRAA